MTEQLIAVSAYPTVAAGGDPRALVQFARVVDGRLEEVPNLVQYQLDIEGTVCGESIEEAVYRLMDRLNGKEDSDGHE